MMTKDQIQFVDASVRGVRLGVRVTRMTFGWAPLGSRWSVLKVRTGRPLMWTLDFPPS